MQYRGYQVIPSSNREEVFVCNYRGQNYRTDEVVQPSKVTTGQYRGSTWEK